MRAKSELADDLSTRAGHLFVNIGEPSLRPLMDHPVRKIILDRNRMPGSAYKSLKDLLDRQWPGDEVMLIKGSLFLALEGLVIE